MTEAENPPQKKMEESLLVKYSR